jgi:hypothetical protein
MRICFLALLVLPIAVAYIAHAIDPLSGIYFLWQFAQVPYVATAVLLGIFIWLAKTSSRIFLLSIFAPLLMGVMETIFMIVIDPPELRSIARAFQLCVSIAPLTVIVSFLFVALSWGLFAVARKLRWVAALP